MKQRTKYNIDIIRKIVYDKAQTILLSQSYENNRQALEFCCGQCGKYFKKRWDNMVSRQSFVCQSCMRSNNNGLKLSETQVDKLCQEMNVIRLEPYKRGKAKLLVQDVEGYRGYTNIECLHKHKHFSKYSSVFNLDNLIYNLNNFAKLHNINARAIRFLGRQGRGTDWVEFECECGNLFKTHATLFVQQNVTRCQRCSHNQSTNEWIVEQYLKEHCVVYVGQKRFDGCRSLETNYLLPFDFYLPAINTIIEVSGEQHEHPVPFGDISYEDAVRNHIRTIQNDCTKYRYCVDNNIQIYYITYKDINNGFYKPLLKHIIRNIV